MNINFALREVTCKIVYYGPGRSGKTTNLQWIHGHAPGKSVGDLVSVATEKDRTLYFDFLPLDLGPIKGMKTSFQLYTVPGQIFYDATRRIVLEGADGVVFVADSHPDMMIENIESLENLDANLRANGLDLETTPIVFQWNKRDLDEALPVDEIAIALNPEGLPAFEAIATSGQGVFPTLKAVAKLVIAKLNNEEPPAVLDAASDSSLAQGVAEKEEGIRVPEIEPVLGDVLAASAGGGEDVKELEGIQVATPAAETLETAVADTKDQEAELQLAPVTDESFEVAGELGAAPDKQESALEAADPTSTLDDALAWRPSTMKPSTEDESDADKTSAANEADAPAAAALPAPTLDDEEDPPPISSGSSEPLSPIAAASPLGEGNAPQSTEMPAELAAAPTESLPPPDWDKLEADSPTSGTTGKTTSEGHGSGVRPSSRAKTFDAAAPSGNSASKLSEAKRQMMNAGKREDAFTPNVPVVEEILEIVEEEDDAIETALPAMPAAAAGVSPPEKNSAPRAASTESRRATRTFEQQSGSREEAPEHRAPRRPGRFLSGLLAGMLGAAVFFAAVGFMFADEMVALGEALGAVGALVAVMKALGANVGPGVMGWLVFCGIVVGAVLLCGLAAAVQDRSLARCFQLGVAWFAVVVLGLVFSQTLWSAQSLDRSRLRRPDNRALMEMIREAEKELEALVEDASQESDQPDVRR